MNRSELILLAEVRAALSSGRAREIREQVGLSQTEVARLCGVAPATLSRWESGGRRARGRPALELGRLLNILEKRWAA